MNLKGIQTHQLLAALGACLAAMLVAGPAAARPYDDGGASNQSAVKDQSLVNQRQLELAADRSAQSRPDEQLQVIPYLSHGVLEQEQTWDVIPYLSHGVLTESDAAALAVHANTSESGIPLSAGIPEPGELIVPGMPELGVFGESTNQLAGAGSRADRPDGYQPQLGVSDFSVVAGDGFDWQTTGFAASILATLAVALTITFTRGNRHGYRSA
jgi:hypothetical protein